MWPEREVAKTSFWQNTTKIMTSLKMESSTIKVVLKLVLITLTFAFLSTACSCSTATFVKAGDLKNDLPTIEVPHKVTVRDRLTGWLHFLMKTPEQEDGISDLSKTEEEVKPVMGKRASKEEQLEPDMIKKSKEILAAENSLKAEVDDIQQDILPINPELLAEERKQDKDTLSKVKDDTSINDYTNIVKLVAIVKEEGEDFKRKEDDHYEEHVIGVVGDLVRPDESEVQVEEDLASKEEEDHLGNIEKAADEAQKEAEKAEEAADEAEKAVGEKADGQLQRASSFLESHPSADQVEAALLDIAGDKELTS